MAVDKRSEVSFFDPSRNNKFCGPNPSPIHIIGFACDSLDDGIRQEVQVLRLRLAQANQLTEQLAILNRRLNIAGWATDRFCI